MNSIVLWFDVQFPASGSIPVGDASQQQGIVLSTSPYSRPTHWKQQVMYISEPDLLEVKQNSIIKGSFALRKSPIDPRDVQVKISMHIS
jgi:hypothetical protein